MAMQLSERRRRELLLLQLPSAIAAAQLGLILRADGSSNVLVINLLVWFCACLLWIDELDLAAELRWSPLAPLSLLSLLWVLVVISRPHTIYDGLLNAVPLATAVSLALLLKGLRWRPLVLLGLLPLFHYVVMTVTPTGILARLTAQISAQFLWLGGRQVLAVGDQLLLPSHVLRVGPGCTGLNALSLCVASALALLLLNGRLSPLRTGLLFLAAPLVSFSVNSLRVALLALMPMQNTASGLVESEAFRFWHTGAGSTLFAFVAVCLLFAVEHLLRQARLPIGHD